MSSTRSSRQIALGSLVLATALAILYGLHHYIAKRLILDVDLPSPWHELSLGALAVLGLTLVAQPICERLVRPPWSRVVAWPAALWMGFAFLALVGLAATDLVLWLSGGVARAAGANPALDGSTTADVRAAVVALVALGAGAFGLRSGLRPPSWVREEFELARWPRALDGFRIVQMSDIHIGPILGRRFSEQLVRRANACEPDLIVITGDLVDGGVRQLRDEVAPFAGLRARHGVSFVTGNHDHYSGAHSWCDQAASLGMRVLRNSRVAIQRDGGVFDLVGVDDHRGSHIGDAGREDLDAALAGRDPSRPAVLLAHDPSTFKRASRMGIDLQLSGHTHGGQIWPFEFLVRLAIPFVAGRYRRGDASLYVSRGTGFWGPPMRLRAPAEITEITLRSAEPNAAADREDRSHERSLSA